MIRAGLIPVTTLLMALSQVPSVQAATEPETDATAGLEEITVTARRSQENLQSVAVPVDVVNPGQLLNGGITDPTQLGEVVPSLSVQPVGGASAAFILRGVGNFTTIGYIDPAIAFNYDGVYIGRATSTSGTFYDLQRIEVLKGPQGTLYGRNATAGAINVIPAIPELGATNATFSVSYGNYSAKDVQAAVNLAVGSTSAIRLSGNIVDRNGVFSDGTGDENTKSGRFQFLTRPSDQLSIRIAADYSHTGGLGSGSSYAGSEVYDPATNGYNFVPSGLGRNIGDLDTRSEAYRTTLYSGLVGRVLDPLYLNNPRPFEDNTFYGVNAEAEYITDVGTLTVIPAYRHAKLDNIYYSYGFPILTSEAARQSSLEARFAGKPIGIFDYLLGAYYFNERADSDGDTFDQQGFSAYDTYASKTNSYAAFARLTAHITDSLRAVGGIRFTEDRKRFDGAQQTVTVICVQAACPTAPLLPLTASAGQLPIALPPINTFPAPIGTTGAIVANTLIPVDKPLNNNKVTYRVGAEYDVAERSLLYAGYETGYRSGGFSLAVGYDTFEPETIDAFTIGSKNRFFDNRLQLNFEAFLWKYKNQQVTHVGLDKAGNQSYFTQNIGRSTIKGFEIESQFLATQTTLFGADVQYLDARYDSFEYDVPAGFTPPVVGCPYGPSATSSGSLTVNCSGVTAYQSPRWTLNLNAQQTVPLTDRYKLVVGADTQYKTARYTGFDYLPFELAGANWRSDATLSLATTDDRWSLTAFVNNIENKRTVTSSLYGSISSAGNVFTTDPRLFGIRLNGKLGNFR